MGRAAMDGDSSSDSGPSADDGAIGSDADTETETDEDVAPPIDSSPYLEGEKVLATHKGHIYEARVIKVEYRLKEWRYFVHYIGWNKNWDEWVGVDRMMKHNEENVKKQLLSNKKQGKNKNAPMIHVSQMKPRIPNAGRGRKRKSDGNLKEKVAATSDRLVNLQIPPTLKKQLIDDCELVTQLGKLVKLPRSPNVDGILKKYMDYRTKKDGKVMDSVGEIVKGLQCYFDKSLSVMLLYGNERPQYEEMVKDDVSPSRVYGAEHLLRLFVKLPKLLYHANIAEETLKELHRYFVDFLKFLQRNQSAFFQASYQAGEATEKSSNKMD